MKRTARDPVRAGLLQRDIGLHDTDKVRLAAQIVDESLRETHFWPGAAIQLIEILADLAFRGDVKHHEIFGFQIFRGHWHSAFECVITELKRSWYSGEVINEQTIARVALTSRSG